MQGIRQESVIKFKWILLILLLMVMVLVFSEDGRTANAETVQKEYKIGSYYYQITDETGKEAVLTGIELTKDTSVIEIPGKAVINGNSYRVARVEFGRNQINPGEYEKNVKKIIVSKDFTGSFDHVAYVFSNLDTIEFLGKTVPERIEIEVWNGRKVLDILIIVPEGLESQYRGVTTSFLNYYNGSDLTEKTIPLVPSVTSKAAGEIERMVFYKNDMIYLVTKSGKDSTGEVSLAGLAKKHTDTYLSLPAVIYNNGYSYHLTEMQNFALVNSKAKIIAIPDTVTRMGSAIFDSEANLIFFSKNCKVLPGYLFFEGTYNNMEFVSIPEGVTEISKNAFNFGKKSGSIILPTTLKSLGKYSLMDFKLVTFLKKKPIAGIAPAISAKTTVKVHQSVIADYKKLLGSKAAVTNSRNIIKAAKLTINKSSLKLAVNKTQTLSAKLTSGSNENIYWMSSDNSILEVSGKGTIKAKKSGTAYVVAYTRTSGLHVAVKVTVTK